MLKVDELARQTGAISARPGNRAADGASGTPADPTQKARGLRRNFSTAAAGSL